jgi:hypothetical protein
MFTEGKELDDMLYAVYLAKLESMKGTKKPLVDFIKKMAEDTNNFYNLTYRQFQLVTRAIHYCTARNTMSANLSDRLSARLTNIIRESATEENILDLLEHWTSRIIFAPCTMEQFICADRMYNIVRTKRPNLNIHFLTSNIPIFNRFPFLVYNAIHKHNPHSLTLALFNKKATKDELDKAKVYSAELTELLEYEDQLTNGDITCN